MSAVQGHPNPQTLIRNSHSTLPAHAGGEGRARNQIGSGEAISQFGV